MFNWISVTIRKNQIYRLLSFCSAVQSTVKRKLGSVLVNRCGALRGENIRNQRAIRYILISDRMLESGESFGTLRDKITWQLELLTLARLLWELFKALIYGVLDTLKNEISKSILVLIKNKIAASISDFLNNALQGK